MVGREYRQLGDGGEGIRPVAGSEGFPLALGAPQETGMIDSAPWLGAKPIVRIVAIYELVDVGGRPVGELRAQLMLGLGDELVAWGLRVAAREQRLRLGVERAQELAL